MNKRLIFLINFSVISIIAMDVPPADTKIPQFTEDKIRALRAQGSSVRREGEKQLFQAYENALNKIKTTAKISDSDWQNLVRFRRILGILNPLWHIRKAIPLLDSGPVQESAQHFHTHYACLDLGFNPEEVEIKCLPNPTKFVKTSEDLISLVQVLEYPSCDIKVEGQISQWLEHIKQTCVQASVHNTCYFHPNLLFETHETIRYALIQNLIVVLKDHEILMQMVLNIFYKKAGFSDEHIKTDTTIQNYCNIIRHNRFCFVAYQGIKQAKGQLALLEQYQRETKSDEERSFLKETQSRVESIMHQLELERKLQQN